MRIVREIEIEGHQLKALFDTGATLSYIRAAFRPAFTRKTRPITVGLGGEDRRLEERCDVAAGIDGLEFDMTAYIVDDLPETEFGQLDVIVGALTMEQWWMKIDPKTGELDLSMLRKREFVEL